MTRPLPRWYRHRNRMTRWERPFWDDHARDMEAPERAATQDFLRDAARYKRECRRANYEGWAEGYRRGVLDQEGELEPADNPYAEPDVHTNGHTEGVGDGWWYHE